MPSQQLHGQTVTSGKYTYNITTEDLKLEQQAFEAGEGVRQSVLYTFPFMYVMFL